MRLSNPPPRNRSKRNEIHVSRVIHTSMFITDKYARGCTIKMHLKTNEGKKNDIETESVVHY